MVIIHRTRPNCTIIRGKIFYPGMNTLSDVEFAAIEKCRGYTSEIACGNMVQNSHTETEASTAEDAKDQKSRAAQMAVEIKSLPVVDAIALVKTLVDAHILKAMALSDGRKGVAEAIESRLVSLRSQEGSDLVPESKSAPEGNGSDLIGKVAGTKEDIAGTKVKTAIPAMKGH